MARHSPMVNLCPDFSPIQCHPIVKYFLSNFGENHPALEQCWIISKRRRRSHSKIANPLPCSSCRFKSCTFLYPSQQITVPSRHPYTGLYTSKGDTMWTGLPPIGFSFRLLERVPVGLGGRQYSDRPGPKIWSESPLFKRSFHGSPDFEPFAHLNSQVDTRRCGCFSDDGNSQSQNDLKDSASLWWQNPVNCVDSYYFQKVSKKDTGYWENCHIRLPLVAIFSN